MDYVKKLHEIVKAQIEKKNESYVKQANKGHKKVIFQSGGWVWVHIRKERFPESQPYIFMTYNGHIWLKLDPEMKMIP